MNPYTQKTRVRVVCVFNLEKGSLFPEKRQYLEMRRRAPGLPVPLPHEKIVRSFVLGDRARLKIIQLQTRRPVFGEIFLARPPFDKGKGPTIS